MTSFKAVAPDYFVTSPAGCEVFRTDGEYAIGRWMPVEDRKFARAYIRGLKILFKASKEKGFFEAAGEQYTGNTNTVESKFKKLQQCLRSAGIVAIGNGAQFSIESYVSGEYSVTVLGSAS